MASTITKLGEQKTETTPNCVIRDALDQLSACETIESARFSQVGWESLYTGPRSSIAKGAMHTNGGIKAVIIKNIRPGPDCQSHQEAARIIENELSIWNKLHDHTHVVAFLGLTNLKLDLSDMMGCASRHGMAVSNYHSGGSLHQVLFNQPQSVHAPSTRLAWLIDAIRGLHYIHSVSVVHGDIKAANIIFDEGAGQAKIGDFGCSRLVCRAGCDHPDKNLTTPANPAWDSPELYSPQQPARSFSSDIWAFGCLALEIQMGRLPYSGTAARNIMWIQRRMLQGHLPATLPDIYSAVTNQKESELVWEVIQQCWNLDPNARPSASNLVDQLERAQLNAAGGHDADMVDLTLVYTS
ncbi:unnamed protein product [Rhizoctonia solani]|uniref:Protein kinase domain-containing protein n=1 Tax=Rhizoctonia solani TaxID=456999 RepID=A0A8H3EAS1_9AGAM|nr:unnamed protein product [Rhizoctonia solani]